MVRQLQSRIVYALELPQHLQEIGLAVQQMAGRNAGGRPEGGPSQMFVIQNLLRLDQFAIELRQRERRRQLGMLDVIQTLIACRHTAGLGMPRFRTMIGCVDADIDNFRDLQTPLADDLKPAAIP